jgi:anti-sigma B factor antagonist
VSLHATGRVDGEVATLVLVGEVEPDSVPRLAELVESVVDRGAHDLEFDLRRLSRLSSAGVRCLVNAHQAHGPKVQMSFHGVRPDVAEAIRSAGFQWSVTVTGPGDL